MSEGLVDQTGPVKGETAVRGRPGSWPGPLKWIVSIAAVIAATLIAAGVWLLIPMDTVYVAGSEGNTQGSVAAIWHGGEVLRMPLSGESAHANHIAVSGKGTYLAGYEGKYAMLWKNGSPQRLTDGKGEAEANALFVEGDAVYAAGFDTKENKKTAMLWKNGSPQTLSVSGDESKAYSVCVMGGDVYAAGYDTDRDGKKIPMLWKNGASQNLTIPGKEYGWSTLPGWAEAYAVAAMGTDVYVAGDVGYNSVLWKNGKPQYLEIEIVPKSQSLCVSGNDLYIAGYTLEYGRKETNRKACFLKNGKISKLDGPKESRANSVVVSGGDVHVIGSGGETKPLSEYPPILWKNGAVQKMPGIDNNCRFGCLATHGGDIYCAGSAPLTADKPMATVWRNGRPRRLTDGWNSASAQEVRVCKKDVYAVGYEIDDDGNSMAILWKNGTPQRLRAGNSDKARAGSIFVSNGDIYVAGNQTDDAKFTPVLWKNGTVQDPTDGRDNGETGGFFTQVFVDGTDTYIAGFDGKPAMLWKNDLPQKLSVAKVDASAASVFATGGNVYAAGFEYVEEVGVKHTVAALWINGVKQRLTPEGKIGAAVSVFVKNNDIYVLGKECDRMDGSKDGHVPKKEDFRTVLWKNGHEQKLRDGDKMDNPSSIHVSNRNVYIAGTGPRGNGEDGLARAVLLKNGKSMHLSLSDRKDYSSQAMNVFVETH